jgi:hypothetical protein
MSADVEFFEAIIRWFFNDPNLKDDHLWGFKISWWGRFGKTIAFVGGFTTVLDLIGPERVKELSERHATRIRKRTARSLPNPKMLAFLSILFYILVPILSAYFDLSRDQENTVLVTTLAPILVYIFFKSTTNTAWSLAIKILKDTRTGRTVRKLGFALFFTGFFFDMLAS